MATDKVISIAKYLENTRTAEQARKKAIRERVKLRNESPYDGVFGTLPNWIPEVRQRFFNDARKLLLNGGGPNGEPVSREQALEWMDAYCWLRDTPNLVATENYFPVAKTSLIELLVHFRDLVSLGEEKGLKLIEILDREYDLCSGKSYFSLLNKLKAAELLMEADKNGERT